MSISMTDHVIDLLPWYVNGRLQNADRNRVSSHLQQCAKCSAELRLQQQLHDVINASVKVEIAPQPSFNKLWDKIVAEELSEEQQLLRPRVATSWAPTRMTVQWLRAHWMSFALVTQTAMIIALIGLTVFRQNGIVNNDADAYRTVTSVAPMNGVIIHVVFDDAIRLVDVKDILLRSNLQVASGPTAAGVYSLRPADTHADFNARGVVHSLREDPRVRFAELSHE